MTGTSSRPGRAVRTAVARWWPFAVRHRRMGDRAAPREGVLVGRGRGRWRSDEGAGSVLTLAVVAVLVVLAGTLGLYVQATVAHARAQLVADLSALSAARESQRAAFGEPGATDPCVRAAQVATHNGGRLTRCTRLAAGRVAVDATMSTPLGATRATALAGPRPP